MALQERITVNSMLRSSLKEVATSSLSEDAHPVLP